MSKKRFVQAVLIRSLPPLERAPAAIEYAESLWDVLTQYGHGDDAPSKPREAKDYYAALTPRQRHWFDRFWRAFNYKKDRNGAAMRWQQLGELSDPEYQHIVQAAKNEAEQPIPTGQSRKMAQGWLHEKRYLDYLPPSDAQHDPNRERRELHNELQHLKRLYGYTPTEALLAQIQQLEHRINAHGNP